MAYEVYDQGRNHMVEVYFQDATFGGPFYIGLGSGSIPEGSDSTLADVTEVTGTGYARQSVERDNVDWTVTDDEAETAAVTFTNSGGVDWDEAEYAFLTLSPTGTDAPNVLIACVEIDIPFTLGGSETKDVQFTIQQA